MTYGFSFCNMAFRVFDQENQVPTGAASRFGSRNGEQKMGLSVITNNMDNLKRVQPSRQGKKAAPAFAVYDENATADFPIKKETTTSIWAPLATQGAKLKEKPVEVEQKIIAQIDQADTKVQRQPLAAIKPKQALEHSACSSSLIDTSLHQSDFVLQAHQFYEEKDVPQNELSPMVVDTSMTEDNKPFASVSDYNQHLDSALPECYMDDIYKYLRDCEERHRPKPHYMRKQADITPGMRAILIDWLVEVAEEYKLHNETLYLAVSFIDRFLSQMSVLRGKLQLVGTAAMFIASKYEEIYPPEVGEFVYITDDTYTKKQVLRMEQLILKVLAFEVAVPTSHYFLQRFIQLSRSSEATLHLATYLCELTLLETEPFLHHQPSEVGAACVALARLSSGHEIWPGHMSQSTGYTLEQLVPCIKSLHASWTQAPANAQQAIREKYKSDKWHCVSLMSPPPLSTLDLAQF